MRVSSDRAARRPTPGLAASQESLPIRCIEAVFLGLLLTTGWEDLLRVPVGFKTSVGRNVYRHIVLIVQVSVAGWCDS